MDTIMVWVIGAWLCIAYLSCSLQYNIEKVKTLTEHTEILAKAVRNIQYEVDVLTELQKQAK